jgi:hypothetical protein
MECNRPTDWVSCLQPSALSPDDRQLSGYYDVAAKISQGELSTPDFYVQRGARPDQEVKGVKERDEKGRTT